MKTANARIQLAEAFLDDGRMSDWQRLGKYVVARRVELGYEQRARFAAAAHISYRLLSDIETARRSNFDAASIARLEKALGWETGSVAAVVAGKDPAVREPIGPTSAYATETLTGTRGGSLNETIAQIDASPTMTAREKLEAIQIVVRVHAQAHAENPAGAGAAYDPTVEIAEGRD